MKPKITVIVPSFNEQELLPGCLESIFKQTLSRKYYSVLVVDNGSTDESVKIAKKMGAKVISEPQKGVVYASMTGAKSAKTKILAFTDADCRVPKDWLQTLLGHFEVNPGLDAVGGLFCFFDGDIILKTVARIVEPLNWHLIGGNYAIKRAALKRLGWFKPKFNFGFDVALTLQLKKRGKFIIDRSLWVKTSARRYSRNIGQTLFLYLVNDLSLILFNKPFKADFSDVRIKKSQKLLSTNRLLYLGVFSLLLTGVLTFFPPLTEAKTVIYQNIKEKYLIISSKVEEKVKETNLGKFKLPTSEKIKSAD